MCHLMAWANTKSNPVCVLKVYLKCIHLKLIFPGHNENIKHECKLCIKYIHMYILYMYLLRRPFSKRMLWGFIYIIHYTYSTNWTMLYIVYSKSVHTIASIFKRIGRSTNIQYMYVHIYYIQIATYTLHHIALESQSSEGDLTCNSVCICSRRTQKQPVSHLGMQNSSTSSSCTCRQSIVCEYH